MLGSHCFELASVRRFGLLTRGRSMTPPATQGAKKRGAGAKQEAEVVPVADSNGIIDRLLIPRTKDVRDENDPGRQAVPESPEQIMPPHVASLSSANDASDSLEPAIVLISIQDRPLLLPIRSLLVGVPNLQDRPLIEGLADDLKADR